MLDALDRDKVAPSARSTQESLWRTWTAFHRKWFGPESDPCPLTVESIRSVASMFKDAGYRSFANYASRAKREHVARGFPWTQIMDLEVRDCNRSLTRGIGPPRQSAEFPVREIWNLDIGDAPRCGGGPVNPRGVAILGAFFLTREIELSLALVANFAGTPGPTGVWKLPATKTDPTAVSVTREWGCLCQEGSNHPCPAHCAVRHLEILHERFAEKGRLDPELPLFPTEEGAVCDKSKVVETFESLGALCGLPVTDPLGRRAFGGHSARVSGARWLASTGLEIVKLAVLARWSSNVVVRYVSDAPLHRVTADCRRLLHGEILSKVLERMWNEISQGKRQLEEFDSLLRNCLIQEAPKPKDTPARQSGLTFVCNRSSGVWHLVFGDPSSSHACDGRTWCGWRFGHRNGNIARSLESDVPFHLLCEKCLPEEKMARKDRECASDSDSSR